MRSKVLALSVIAVLAILVTGAAIGQGGFFTLQAGASQDAACAGGGELVLNRPFKLSDGSADRSLGRLRCKPSAVPVEPTATATATPAPVEPTATATAPATGPVEPYNLWHAPAAHDGLNAHEHGSEPPQWLTDWSMSMFGHGLIYGGDEATPNENIAKHQAFKGAAFTLQTNSGPVQVYLRTHAQTNPMGHMARFHSFEFWALDPAGNVSLMQGWLDYAQGNAAGPNTYYKNCGEQNTRPIISVNTQTCGRAQFEDWYSLAGGTYDASQWGPDTGQNLSPTAYAEGDPYDSATWVRTGDLGLTRRYEIAWYPNRAAYVFNTYGGGFDQVFYTDQWLRPVSGPSDPVCGSENVIGGKSYTVNCIPQFVASTLPEISFGTTGGNNARQIEFPGAGIVTELPN